MASLAWMARTTLTEVFDEVKTLKRKAYVSAEVLKEWLASETDTKNPVAVATNSIREKMEEIQTEINELMGASTVEDEPERKETKLKIGKLERSKRMYEQLEEWSTTHEVPASTVYQTKDSLVNTIAELKRQIYYVQAMKDGHVKEYRGAGAGLATYEEVVAAEDPAPGERFRLDQMAREAYKAQLPDPAELAKAKQELAVAQAKLAAAQSGGAGPEEVREAEGMVADATKKWGKKAVRGGPPMPAMGDGVQFKPTTLLGQTIRRQQALQTAINELVGDDLERLELEEVKKLNEELEKKNQLIFAIRTALDRRIAALEHELEIVGSIYKQSKLDGSVRAIEGGYRLVPASRAINPELLPYARLGIGPELDLD